MLAVMAVVAAASTAGLLLATRRTVDSVARIAGVATVLSPANPNVENYLLVGSDNRAKGDPNTGTTGDVTGSRSDTMMILRIDSSSGSASLLSIPRDLYVERADGSSGRINAAFNDGAAALTQTVQSALGIPVHHYVEVDFVGFKQLVDAMGGVEICFLFPTRDVSVGLNIVEPGCQKVDGLQALAFARSRNYEDFREGEWQKDPTADLGRTKRQRQFMRLALSEAFDRVLADPLRAGELTDAMTSAVSVDEDTDLLDTIGTLRQALRDDLQTYSLPVVGDTVDGNSVLRLTGDADAVLAFFSGASDIAPPVE
jgi:LCP family protein required for cell wall assembly